MPRSVRNCHGRAPVAARPRPRGHTGQARLYWPPLVSKPTNEAAAGWAPPALASIRTRPCVAAQAFGWRAVGCGLATHNGRGAVAGGGKDGLVRPSGRDVDDKAAAQGQIFNWSPSRPAASAAHRWTAPECVVGDPPSRWSARTARRPGATAGRAPLRDNRQGLPRGGIFGQAQRGPPAPWQAIPPTDGRPSAVVVCPQEGA